MEKSLEQLIEFRTKIKDSIYNKLIDLHKTHNNGELNWSDDGDIIIDTNDYELKDIKINVEVFNSYTDDILSEELSILQYIITIDNDLIFLLEKDEMDCDWTDITTDDLVKICDVLFS
jgi:hypothetical protein